ncbi:MAG: RluA family pseudouridine synthase [Tannerella sp.]|uniref:RluA family pseudouridine synthase n=1 Tax=Tannerella sp. TaxID=2382127 RepID=UPI003FA2A594
MTSQRKYGRGNRPLPNNETLPRGERATVKLDTTLLPYLFDQLKDRSKSSVKSLLKHGQIWVNGKVNTHFDTPLRPGDEVLISHERAKTTFNNPYLRIVWEDESLIVIEKKDGLLSVSESQAQERTAYAFLSGYVREQDPRNRVFVLHRLDRGTSGLMMFARNKGVQEKLRNDWSTMITRRSYVAVVEGRPDPAQGRLVSYLAENSRMKVFCTDASRGKEAVMRYRVLQSNDRYSLVECELETGRKNQIRAQMEEAGYPVAGDPKYGAKTDPAQRLMLHAFGLSFIHPVTEHEVAFETPIPSTFRALVKD